MKGWRNVRRSHKDEPNQKPLNGSSDLKDPPFRSPFEPT